MTYDELRDLAGLVRIARGRCNEKGFALEEFLRRRPLVDRREARAAALAVDRAPWPSIDGNPPIDRTRPYFDSRFWSRQ